MMNLFRVFLLPALLGPVLVVASLTAVGAPVAAAASERQQLDALYADYWRDWSALQARVGDTLEDSWQRDVTAMLKRYESALLKFDPAPLPEQDRISYEMLHYELAQKLSYYDTGVYATARMLPINQFTGQHMRFALNQSGAGTYTFKTVADYDHALRLADDYARWTGDAVARMREGVAKGVVLPRIVVERVLPQLQQYFGLPPEKTVFWQPIAKFPATIPAADRQRLGKAYAAKIADVIEPAYHRLYTYMHDEYLPHTSTQPGLGKLPGGAALYAYDIRVHTTTDMTPAQIHALGLAEVRKITKEMEGVLATVGFHGTLAQFLAHVRTDEALHFHDPEEVVPAYQAALARILPTLPKLFDTMPKAKLEIRPIPEASAKVFRGNGEYQAAAADGSRPGILWINPYAPGITDKFIVMATTLHETEPGHHLQTSLAQEIEGLPAFRRRGFFNAYGEGWALYCESLGQELGLYDDPWQYYGYLTDMILRANRLVIDTGIHAMGWSTEQGIEWMMAHSSMTREQAAVEVERYVAYPGQALSYKIGQLDIEALRAKASRALGPRFDIRKFHDQVLLSGSMPLAILDQKVNRWIGRSAAATGNGTTR
ncbi:MAG: DUF885 domain-containing protein [Xanthomonadales bacterium]|nr:DUF885 domain-containing protein [Xanthomonadales bacterium]